MPGHTIEFHQTPLGVAPKTLNTVDMSIAPGELIFAVVHAQMLIKAHINQAIVAAPAIGMNHASYIRLASDDGLQDRFGAFGTISV